MEIKYATYKSSVPDIKSVSTVLQYTIHHFLEGFNADTNYFARKKMRMEEFRMHISRR
jgi:hypothetical protein